MPSARDDEPTDAASATSAASGAGGDDATGAPGEPVPKDAVDPELINLRPRTQIGLVTSFALVLFCVVVGVRLRGDLGFAGEGATSLRPATDIAGGRVAANSHIQVKGQLDRIAAARVRKSISTPGLRLVPMHGTGDRVWVALDGDSWSEPHGDAGFRGRLRRLDELPFADALRAQVAKARAPRYVTADELRRAHLAGDTQLTTIGGDAFAVAATDELEVVVVDPTTVTVVTSFNRRLPDADAWTEALVEAGLIAPGAQPQSTARMIARYEIRRPDAFASVTAALAGAGLWGARLEPVTRRMRTAWADAVLREDGLVVDDGTEVPWHAVDVIAVHAARRVPGDAWVLLDGEHPDRYWYIRPLYGALVLFGALFAWALARSIKREFMGPKAPVRS